MPLRIEDYALIGDCETAALVGTDGSIDWLCWPRFDSDACFAALLGTSEHGRWLLAPSEAITRVTRRYRGTTLVLETRFETENSAVLVIDFMPPRDDHSNLVRLVVGERGRTEMRVELVVRFGYGALVPWVYRQDDGTLRAIAGPDQAVLRTTVPLRGDGPKTIGDFTVAEGEAISFTLSYAPSHLPPPDPADPFAALEVTERFWNGWSAQARIEEGERHGAVMRSLITLKALTYAPTGGIVAAPTTSLPETLGGIRNWDYRFCWLRDATLSLLALMNAGYYEEAGAWRDWLLRAVAGAPAQAQIMYSITGRAASHRMGNRLAYLVMKAPSRFALVTVLMARFRSTSTARSWTRSIRHNGVAWRAAPMRGRLQKAFLAHLEEIWRVPDRGIWESRRPPRHFTFSKVMAWVAFDRGVENRPRIQDSMAPSNAGVR